MGADAVTFGHDIYLRAGRFAPEQPEGLALLAHELTHVMQRGSSPARVVARPSEQGVQRWEKEAADVERDVHRSLMSAPQGNGSPSPTFPADRALTYHLPPAAARTVSPSKGEGLAKGFRAAPSASTPLRAAEDRPAAEGESGGAEVDIAEVANQVYRVLQRRLLVERERLGVGRHA
jgi:hypothetical protein